MRLAGMALLAVLGLAFLPAGSDGARTCKKFKEQQGCRLPNPAGYAAARNVYTLTITGGNSDANGRFKTTCTGGGQPASDQEVEWPIDRKLNFPGRPRIGKTYDVESETVNPPDSSGNPATYLWTGRLKVTSAKKVSLTLGYTFSGSGTFGDPRRCSGEVTKTLLRVKSL